MTKILQLRIPVCVLPNGRRTDVADWARQENERWWIKTRDDATKRNPNTRHWKRRRTVYTYIRARTRTQYYTHEHTHAYARTHKQDYNDQLRRFGLEQYTYARTNDGDAHKRNAYTGWKVTKKKPTNNARRGAAAAEWLPSGKTRRQPVDSSRLSSVYLCVILLTYRVILLTCNRLCRRE